jgi:diguanylate cyclase (GGDEF)-like protein
LKQTAVLSPPSPFPDTRRRAETLRRLISFVGTEGALFLAAIAVVQWAVTSENAPVIRFSAYVVLAAGVFLSWRLHRSRLLFTLLALALAAVALLLVPAPMRPRAGLITSRLLFDATAVLLPVNLALLAFLPERGARTNAVMIRLAAILGQAFGVWQLVRTQPDLARALLEPALIPKTLITWSQLPQPALMVLVAAFGVLGVRLVRHPEPLARGAVWALCAAALALYSWPARSTSLLYITTAGLILVVATLESVYAMAYRDELTGLLGRRALNEAVLRLGDKYTAAVVDIDHFKQFNDRYGHHVGDQVLRMVATRLAAVNGGARAFRSGGEEFTILFDGKKLAEIEAHLEAVRRAVADSNFVVRGADRRRAKGASRKGVKVTISIGAAESNGRHGSPEEVMAAADKALYRAKEGGRNRIES